MFNQLERLREAAALLSDKVEARRAVEETQR